MTAVCLSKKGKPKVLGKGLPPGTERLKQSNRRKKIEQLKIKIGNFKKM
jgi:hypothetical protein